MIDGLLDLYLHGLAHLTLRVPSVEAENADYHHQRDEKDTNEVLVMVAVIVVNNAHFEVLGQELIIQQLLAVFGRVREACADSIHDSLTFQLTAVSRIVDHDRGVDA